MVVASAALDMDQLGAMFELWRLWAREEHGHNLDTQAWWANQMQLVGTGVYMPIVAWEGAEPVGMVEVYTNYDPAARETWAHGDHAFVKQEYRGEGVFRVLYEAADAVARIAGATKFMVPVGVDGPGPMLRDMYAREGFGISGYYMRKAA